VYAARGDYDLAIADYSKAISLGFAYEGVFYARALAYQALGKKAEAIQDFREVLGITTDVNLRKDAEQQLQALGESP
jgi:tetratricopeptide (TPR) repeat protein